MIDLEDVKKYVINSLFDTIHEMNSTQISENTKHKEQRDIVTNYDLFIEQTLIEKLKHQYPTHYFSSEEAGEAKIDSTQIEDIYEWVIDPIDGAINFAAGLPWYSTSIALKHNDEVVFRIVHIHAKNEMYTAIKGKGSFCNKTKIQVSKNQKMSESVLSFMLTSHYDEHQTDDILNIVRKLSLNTRGLRLLVSQALELCLIASGKLDGTVCIKSRGFSSSAGSLIVQEAGGKVTTINGEERSQKATSLLVTNGLIHNEAVTLIN